MPFDFICLKKSEDLFDEYIENSSPKKLPMKKSMEMCNPEAPFGLEIMAERKRQGHLLK